MHLVLRSSQAKGDLSFATPKNRKVIGDNVQKFSIKYGIKILSLANVGNHIHLHIRISKRGGYKAFIRATTSAIRLGIAGSKRWNTEKIQGKFWDYRPFSRVIRGLRSFLTIKDYILINRAEGLGIPRSQVKYLIRSKKWSSDQLRIKVDQYEVWAGSG